jgi:hypothetical protein
MADGREEREEQRKRRELEERENSKDRLDEDYANRDRRDESQPERGGSSPASASTPCPTLPRSCWSEAPDYSPSHEMMGPQ